MFDPTDLVVGVAGSFIGVGSIVLIILWIAVAPISVGSLRQMRTLHDTAPMHPLMSTAALAMRVNLTAIAANTAVGLAVGTQADRVGVDFFYRQPQWLVIALGITDAILMVIVATYVYACICVVRARRSNSGPGELAAPLRIWFITAMPLALGLWWICGMSAAGW